MRAVLVGAGEPWMAEYCKRIMLLNFSQDQDGLGRSGTFVSAAGRGSEPESA